jgi:hypothetical protein
VARYRYSGKALATALGTNVVEIRTPSTARARLRHLKVFSEAATALNLALFRTTVVGTAGTAVTATKTDPADAAPGSSVVTGPTGGTLEATAPERAFLPAAAGAAVVLYSEGDDELYLPASSSFMVRNDGAAAGPAITWELEIEES